MTSNPFDFNPFDALNARAEANLEETQSIADNLTEDQLTAVVDVSTALAKLAIGTNFGVTLTARDAQALVFFIDTLVAEDDEDDEDEVEDVNTTALRDTLGIDGDPFAFFAALAEDDDEDEDEDDEEDVSAIAFIGALLAGIFGDPSTPCTNPDCPVHGNRNN